MQRTGSCEKLTSSKMVHDFHKGWGRLSFTSNQREKKDNNLRQKTNVVKQKQTFSLILNDEISQEFCLVRHFFLTRNRTYTLYTVHLNVPIEAKQNSQYIKRYEMQSGF